MDWHNYPDQFVSSPDPRLSAGDEGQQSDRENRGGSAMLMSTRFTEVSTNAYGRALNI